MDISLQLQRFCFQDQCVDLFVPQAAEVQERFKMGNLDAPYWSRVWPAALALTDFIFRNSLYVKKKKVLELAAGLGLPSLAASRFATEVVCSDYLPQAVEVMERSIRHNGLQNVSARLLDWLSLPSGLQADVLLLSDVNYDPSVFQLQHKMITDFIQKGTRVLVSTPQRLMAKAFITPLLVHCTRQEEIRVPYEGREVAVSVLVLGK